MAYLPAAAIATRLREVLEDGAGSLRTVSSRFGGDLPEGLTDEETTRRALLDLKPLRIRLRPGPTHPNRLTVAGNYQIKYVDADITVARSAYVGDQLDDDLREAISAQVLLDGDVIEQACEWPSNLAQTTGGTDTNVKGGTYEGLRGDVVVRGDVGEAQVIEATHRVRLTVVSRPAVS